MSAPAKPKPKRIRWKVATDPLDVFGGIRRLWAEHEDRMNGPRAPACRCPRPWPTDERRCAKCGRRVG